MTTRAVLALDLGNKTGWAIAAPNGALQHGFRDFEDIRRDGARFLAFRQFLHDRKLHIEANGWTLGTVAHERVTFLQRGSTAAHVYGAYWGLTCAWTEHHGIEIAGLAVSTVRKFAIGNGRAKKSEVFEELRARGHKVTDGNEADALAVLLAWQAINAQQATREAA